MARLTFIARAALISRYATAPSTVIWLYVALGSAAGGTLRFAVSRYLPTGGDGGFPITTLAINIVGSALLGYLAARFATRPGSVELRAMLTVGFCGGFTTFSAFSVETLGLLQRAAYGRAALYATASVLACIAAAAVGSASVRS